MTLTYEGYNQVKEFHLKFGHLVFQGTGVTTEAVRLLRARLILEELGELAMAVHDQDQILTADAVSDLLYVTLGTAVSCTGPIPDPWDGSLRVLPLSPIRAIAEVTTRVTRVVTSLAYDRDVRHLRHNLVLLTVGLMYFRLPLRELLAEVHTANMTKLPKLTTDHGQKYGPGGGNGPGYQPPDIQRVLREHPCTIT